ncbi:hypothetical protein L7F22_053563 [Adiantum nelumboides]|nr:hypothetical protein [Adiantum nelumboides]
MAGPPPVSEYGYGTGADGHHLPCSSTDDYVDLMLGDYPSLDDYVDLLLGDCRSLDPTTTVHPSLPLNELCLQQYGTTDCNALESIICDLQPPMFERLPSFVGFVAPPPSQPSEELLYSPSHMENMSGLATGPAICNINFQTPVVSSMPTISPPGTLPPDNICTGYLCALLEGFNAEVAPPLQRQDSFSFTLCFDQSNFGDATSSIVPPLSVVNVRDNQITVVNAAYQVSQLYNMVWDGSTDLQQLDQSNLPGVQFSISAPPTSPTYMNGTVYTGAMLDTMKALHSSNVTSPSSLFLRQASDAEFEAPTSFVGVTAEKSSNKRFHGMGSVHGGNLAATRVNKTEDYRRIDRLAWRKSGQAGGIKTRKKPRTTSLSEDNDPVYNGSKVKFRVKTLNVNLDDGFLWSKYGEKEIIKHKHPRSYLRCIENSSKNGCRVLKRVQRCSSNEEYVEFMYLGLHNHHP